MVGDKRGNSFKYDVAVHLLSGGNPMYFIAHALYEKDGMFCLWLGDGVHYSFPKQNLLYVRHKIESPEGI